MVGTTPLIKGAVDPAGTPSDALLAVLQAEATAVVAAAGLQQLLRRVLMVDVLWQGLGEKLHS